VTDAILSGQWVIDVRDRVRFAEGHLAGSVSLEHSDLFATYVGWLVPWGAELVLLADRPDVLATAVHDLAAIGIDGVGGYVLGRDDTLTARFRRADWAAYREAATSSAPPPVLVDVRQRDEWAAGHLVGAVHVPVQHVERCLPALPDGELWVHCKSGYRAGIAASLLHRHGRAVVHVDDSWDRVDDLDLRTVPAAA
jgi:rhodanese-related sulfurtransferase